MYGRTNSGSFKRVFDVNDKAVVDVALGHAVIGLVDIINVDLLNHAHDIVLGAEIKLQRSRISDVSIDPAFA